MRSALMVLFYFVCAQLAYSQPCSITLRGKVMDANSVNTLQDVSVQLQETGETVFSDVNGKFLFTKLCPGQVTLTFSHVGCEAFQCVFNLASDTVLKLKMNHSETELEEVQVTTTKAERHETQSVYNLTEKQLKQVSGVTLAVALQQVPGVYSLSNGTNISKPVIHGLHSNRVVIVNNGVRLEGQQWGSEHVPEIDVNNTGSISVMRGAASLLYGSDALGGVILVGAPKLPTKHGISGELSTSLSTNNVQVNTSLMLEGCFHRLPDLSWRVNGTFKQAGNAKAPGYWLKNTGVLEGDFSANIGYRKPRYGVELFFSRYYTELGVLRDAHTGNLTDLQDIINRGRPLSDGSFTYNIQRPSQLVTHYLMKAKTYYQTLKGDEFNLSFSWQQNQRSEYDVPGFYQTNKTRPGYEFAIQTITVQPEWHHRQIRKWAGVVGANVTTQTNEFKYAYFIPDFRSVATALFFTERYVANKLEFEGGLRFDYKWAQYYVRNNTIRYDTSLHFYAPSGNVGVEYHVNSMLGLRLNLGSAFRVPSANELFADGVHHGAAVYETGNVALKPEQSVNGTLGVAVKHKYVRLDADLFTNYIHGFINLVPIQPARQTIRGAFPSYYYTQQNALLSGVDVDFAVVPISNLEMYNKTSLLFARNTQSHSWLEQMPPHRFESGVKYEATVSKMPVDLTAALFVVNVMRQTQLPTNTTDYAAPPAAYWTLNASFYANFHLKAHNLMAGVTASNITNNAYRDYLDRFRYYADAAGFNATIRVAWQFFVREHSK